MPWRQPFHVPKKRTLGWAKGIKCKDRCDDCLIKFVGSISGHTFDIASDAQLTAIKRVKERPRPDVISCAENLIALGIDNQKCEVADQMVDAFFAPPGIGFENELVVFDRPGNAQF
nr:hypothetical protein [Pontixanthobacter aestiaquae]